MNKLFKYICYWVILVSPIPFCWGQTDIPIGTWRNHLSYSQAKDVAITPDQVFCSTINGFFFLDKEELSLTKVSKIDGLSGVNISVIGYDIGNDVLVIAYEDGNLDLVSGNEIINFDGIQKSEAPGSKRINQISFLGDLAYLSSDLGMIVFDLVKIEIKESYTNLGMDGEPLPIRGSAFSTDSIFLATPDGVLASGLDPNLNLLDYRNWKRFGPAQGIPADEVQVIASLNNKIYTGVNLDGLYGYQNDTWSILNISLSGQFITLNASSDRLYVTNGNQLWEMDGMENFTQISTQLLAAPQSALLDDQGKLWVADGMNGLVSDAQGAFQSFFPDGPFSNDIFKMISFDQIVTAVSGGYDQTRQPKNNSNGFYSFETGFWNNFNPSGLSGTTLTPDLEDLVDVVVSNQGNTYYFASFGYGILSWENGSFKIIDENSPGSTLINLNPPGRFTQIASVALDMDGGLWAANYGVSPSLHLLNADDTWDSYMLASPGANYPLGLMILGNGDLWIRLDPDQGGGIIVFNPDSNQERHLSTLPGQGGLPSNTVNDFILDGSGQVWIGTDLGLAFIPDPTFVLSGEPVDALQPIFDSQILLEDVRITALDVDGGNRKWIGTEVGIWLFEDSGDELVFNFTTQNSPLLSDQILDIEIEPVSGEVFIGTGQGIISFRGTATEGTPKFENVKIFPNPVTRDFTGLVGISGVANDAIIKITDISGKLVKEILAQGGTAVWDVKDINGRRASTGVYLVLSTSSDGEETFVGKIAVIN